MNRKPIPAAGVIALAIVAAALASGCDGPATDGGGGGVDSESSVIAVEYLGTSHEVDVADLAAEDVGGVPAARLDALLRAALPAADPTRLAVDFVAYDGFSPAQSPNCVDLIPLDASVLDRGWIEVGTANLAWDGALRFPGCMHVRGVVEVLVYDAE
jgi:hypothetical protein